MKTKLKNLLIGFFAIAIGFIGGLEAISANKSSKKEFVYIKNDLSKLRENFSWSKMLPKKSEPERDLLIGSVNSAMDGEIYLDHSVKKKKDLVRIGWVGDIAPYNLDKEKSKIQDPFENVHLFLSNPDLMLANLEGQITEHEISKCSQNEENCFSFKGSQEFLKKLHSSGIDGFNLANNHANDYGEIGYTDTRDALNRKELLYAGGPEEIAYTKIKKTTIALIGASPHQKTLPMINDYIFSSSIKKAKENADIVIVMVHAGSEGLSAANTPNEDEFFLGRNRGNIRKQSRLAIDSGADAVLGSGPHVLRGVEFYKNKPIAYSLGNFLGHQTLSTVGLMGISAILYLDFDTDGNFVNGQIIPVYLNESGIPKIDQNSIGITIMKKLSEEDFLENSAKIDSQGTISLPRL